PGLKSWEVSNNILEKTKKMMELLRSQNFSSPLNFVQKGNKILLTGRLSLEEQQQLKDFIETLKKDFPTSEFIYQNIDTSAPQVHIWPSPITGIGGNAQTPFVELSNGLRLQIGSKLPSGYQIVDIDENFG